MVLGTAALGARDRQPSLWSIHWRGESCSLLNCEACLTSVGSGLTRVLQCRQHPGISAWAEGLPALKVQIVYFLSVFAAEP